METVAVHADPKQVRRFALTCLVFVLIAVVAAFDHHLLIGLLGVLLFGPPAVVYGLRLRNPQPLIELTAAGLRSSVGGLAPWRDIEDVGVGVIGSIGPVVGIRLSDYVGYVRSIGEDLPRAKRFAIWANAMFAASPASRSEGFTSVQRRLMALLAWNRRKSGRWDICYQQRVLPDSPEVIVHQILTYRASALEH